MELQSELQAGFEAADKKVSEALAKHDQEVIELGKATKASSDELKALKEYLTDITTSHTYNKVKDEVWNLLGKVSKFGPNAQEIAQKIEGNC